MNMIELEKISRNYSSGENVVQALIEVDLQIQAGEYLSILGPSGSGKSTLMHILGCLDRPSRGRYLLEGADVSSLTINQMAAVRSRTIGFIFQRFHLLARSTALQNVAMPMRLAKVKKAERERRAAEFLDRVGLADRMHHRPAELSGGQQQRVAIARALANGPRLLLADEPTGNLDSASGKEIIELLEELNTEGTTVIVVTHDEKLSARTPRVVRVLDGRIANDVRASSTGG
jgi:putative ABC transport system ATP-binding protein